jgi:hypothetical protein
MMNFITAGILYMVGVAIVLISKPSFMFTPDGRWKEFGIGKGEEYTTFPFWMFCLVWAFLSFSLVIFIEPSSSASASASNVSSGLGGVSANRANANTNDTFEDNSVELPKGYYVLNKKATALSGVPKYVYLGPEEP